MRWGDVKISRCRDFKSPVDDLGSRNASWGVRTGVRKKGDNSTGCGRCHTCSGPGCNYS